MKHVILILCGVILLLPMDRGGDSRRDDAVPDDLPAAVFRDYEQRWRAAMGDAAAKLRAGEFADGFAVRDYLAERCRTARIEAFRPLAEREQELLGGDRYSAEKHAEILEGYAAR